jgi:hypothetical protein
MAGLAWLMVSAYRRAPGGLVSWWIAVYLIWYLGVYWLVAFSVWPRYVYLIAPFALLVGAQGVTWLTQRWRWGILAAVILIVGLSWNGASRAEQLSRDPAAQGIDDLAAALNRDFAGMIVYDYWLGWELGWYLGRESRVWLVYFSTPEELAARLQTEEGARYFVAPSAELAYPWVALLNANGIETTLVQTTEGGFTIYRLLPPNREGRANQPAS